MKSQCKKTKPQSFQPKSSSWTGTVFLHKCHNGKKKPGWAGSHQQTPVGRILEVEAAKSPWSGRHSCSSAQTFMFLWAGWTALGRTAKGSCFPANSHTLASKYLGGKNLHPRLSFGFQEASQNEVGKLDVITVCLQLPTFIFCSQRTNFPLANVGSKCPTGARTRQNLFIGASNDFFTG